MENIKTFVKNHGFDDGVCMVYHTSDDVKTLAGESVLGIHLSMDTDSVTLLIEGNGERNYWQNSEHEIKHVWNQVAKENIDTLLHDGIVSFSYEKKDGSIREAVGTLVSEMCPKTKGNGRPMPKSLQLYYDLECNSYKCFTKSKLLEVKGNED